MIQIKNKFITAFLASALTMSSVLVVIPKDTNIVCAAESKALREAKAKISHLTKSLKTNYLGLKNQGTWQTYIKQSRELIKKIPNSEKAQRDALTIEVNKDEALVNALARINQVEKSIAPKDQGGYGNALISKNVSTWREYIRLANIDLEKVDKNVFKNQYDELVSRRDEVNGKLDAIASGIYDSKYNYFIYSNSIDIDGDGKKDLVQIWGHKWADHEEYDYYQEIKVSVKTSNKIYSAEEKEFYSYAIRSWEPESDIRIADFNGDNKKEIVFIGVDDIYFQDLYVFELDQDKLKSNKIDYDSHYDEDGNGALGLDPKFRFGLDIKIMDNYKLKVTSSILGKEEIVSYKYIDEEYVYIPNYTFKDVDNDGIYEIIQSFYTTPLEGPGKRGVSINNYIKYENGKFKLTDMKVMK